MTLTEFAELLGGGMDRTVVDKTGLTGIFNFRQQSAKDQATSGFLQSSSR